MTPARLESATPEPRARADCDITAALRAPAHAVPSGYIRCPWRATRSVRRSAVIGVMPTRVEGGGPEGMPGEGPMAARGGGDPGGGGVVGTEGRMEKGGAAFLFSPLFGLGPAERGRRWRVLSHGRPGKKSARRATLRPP